MSATIMFFYVAAMCVLSYWRVICFVYLLILWTCVIIMNTMKWLVIEDTVLLLFSLYHIFDLTVGYNVQYWELTLRLNRVSLVGLWEFRGAQLFSPLNFFFHSFLLQPCFFCLNKKTFSQELQHVFPQEDNNARTHFCGFGKFRQNKRVFSQDSSFCH